MSKGRLVYGMGINDADYPVFHINKDDNGCTSRGFCPFYKRWSDMLRRCYSNKYPSYVGCEVCDEWLVFSNFKSWMETQDWEGKDLDKDLLIEGNKVYSPDTCVFIHPSINNFLINNGASRGLYPIGVSTANGRFKAECNNPLKGKKEYLGYYDTPEEAHQVYLEYKSKLAVQIANSDYVTDERVKQALLNRYKLKDT